MARSLPIAPEEGAASRRRALPLLGAARPVDRASRPLYAVWEITLRCDLSCHHCGSRAGKPRQDELTTEEALRLVDDMATLGVTEVSLIGGEVYLRDDWAKIAERVVSRGMTCGIVTGGRGFTRERARIAVDAGVSGVSVSIDGHPPEHDALRGLAGSHARARLALENLAAEGMPRAVNTQINRKNLATIPGFFETLLPLGIYGWQVQFTVAMGRAADHPEVLLQPHDMLELLPMLASLKPRCEAEGIRLWPGNNIGYFGPLESVFRGRMHKGHAEPCTAGKTTLGIEANGDIKGCPSLPSADYVGGNVREHSLQDIWERAEALRFTRERPRTELWGHCATCYYAENCMGGCTWTSHVLFARRGNNPYCHHRALELLERGLRERLVLVERAEGVPFDHGEFELIEEPWPEDELRATLARSEALVEQARSSQDSLLRSSSQARPGT